jgi:hypothetical protein
VIKELLAGEPSTSLEGAGAIDVPALLDREYRLNMFSYTQVRPGRSDRPPVVFPTPWMPLTDGAFISRAP